MRNSTSTTVSRMQSPVLALLLIATAGGCSQPSADKDTGSQSPASQEQTAASISFDAESAETLRDAGVVLTLDEKQGRVLAADFGEVQITDALAASLAKLPSIEKLRFQKSELSEAGWKTLSQLAALQQLDIRDCRVDNPQLLSAVAGMPKLKALRLSGQSGETQVDDDGLAALRGCPDLRVLAADGLWISGDGLQHLANCSQLTELYLKGTLLDDAAMTQLAQFKQLKKLRLAKTSIGAAGLQALVELPVEELDVSECSQILDDAMPIVGKLHSLKRLNLWRDVITNAGAEQLQSLVNLEWLNLDNTHVSDAGMEFINDFPKLTFLHLGSTSVTDAGMPTLTSLKALKDLKVTRTGVTSTGVGIIQAAIPDVDVQLEYVEGQ